MELPPRTQHGSKNYDVQTVEYMEQIGALDFGGGDINSLGNESSQVVIHADQVAEERNTAGKQYLTKRDKDIWSVWPKS